MDVVAKEQDRISRESIRNTKLEMAAEKMRHDQGMKQRITESKLAKDKQIMDMRASAGTSGSASALSRLA